MAKPPKKDDNNDPPPPPEGTNLMPLVAFLREATNKESGWHRNAERRARGLFPVTSLSIQLEPWERQLVSTVGYYGSTVQYSYIKWRQAQARHSLYRISHLYNIIIRSLSLLLNYPSFRFRDRLW
jgi:hypothetical protein